MKKYFAFGLLPVMLMALLAAGCVDKRVTALKNAVSEFNDELPMSIGSLGDVTSVAYDEEENNIVLDCSVNDDFLTYQDYEKTDKKSNLRAFKVFLTESSMKPLAERLSELNAGMIINYKWQKSGDTNTLAIPGEEIRDALENPMTEEEKSKVIIENFINNSVVNCPMEIEDGITLVNVFDDGGNIVYLCEASQEQHNVIGMIEANKDNIKTSMLLGMGSDPTMHQICKALKIAGRGLTYRYVGNITRDSVDITISPDEVYIPPVYNLSI